MNDREVFDLYKKGITPGESILKGVSKSQAYKVYQRYNFLKAFLSYEDKLIDMLLAVSKRNFDMIKGRDKLE